jgi:hypothetical protein
MEGIRRDSDPSTGILRRQGVLERPTRPLGRLCCLVFQCGSGGARPQVGRQVVIKIARAKIARR